MEFKERLKELLDENGLNYNTLAKKTGIPVTTLSNYINRSSYPSIVQLKILADYFNVSVDYLIGREDEFGNVSLGSSSSLTKDEQTLLSCFNKISPFERETILKQIKALAGENK